MLTTNPEIYLPKKHKGVLLSHTSSKKIQQPIAFHQTPHFQQLELIHKCTQITRDDKIYLRNIIKNGDPELLALMRMFVRKKGVGLTVSTTIIMNERQKQKPEQVLQRLQIALRKFLAHNKNKVKNLQINKYKQSRLQIDGTGKSIDGKSNLMPNSRQKIQKIKGRDRIVTQTSQEQSRWRRKTKKPFNNKNLHTIRTGSDKSRISFESRQGIKDIGCDLIKNLQKGFPDLKKYRQNIVGSHSKSSHQQVYQRLSLNKLRRKSTLRVKQQFILSQNSSKPLKNKILNSQSTKNLNQKYKKRSFTTYNYNNTWLTRPLNNTNSKPPIYPSSSNKNLQSTLIQAFETQKQGQILNFHDESLCCCINEKVRSIKNLNSSIIGPTSNKKLNKINKKGSKLMITTAYINNKQQTKNKELLQKIKRSGIQKQNKQYKRQNQYLLPSYNNEIQFNEQISNIQTQQKQQNQEGDMTFNQKKKKGFGLYKLQALTISTTTIMNKQTTNNTAIKKSQPYQIQQKLFPNQSFKKLIQIQLINNNNNIFTPPITDKQHLFKYPSIQNINNKQQQSNNNMIPSFGQVIMQQQINDQQQQLKNNNNNNNQQQKFKCQQIMDKIFSNSNICRDLDSDNYSKKVIKYFQNNQIIKNRLLKFKNKNLKIKALQLGKYLEQYYQHTNPNYILQIYQLIDLDKKGYFTASQFYKFTTQFPSLDSDYLNNTQQWFQQLAKKYNHVINRVYNKARFASSMSSSSFLINQQQGNDDKQQGLVQYWGLYLIRQSKQFEQFALYLSQFDFQVDA